MAGGHQFLSVLPSKQRNQHTSYMATANQPQLNLRISRLYLDCYFFIGSCRSQDLVQKNINPAIILNCHRELQSVKLWITVKALTLETLLLGHIFG